MKWLIQVLVLLFFASEGISLHAQTGGKAFGQCDHDAVLTVLRAYEDSLAVATSSTVVRVDYAWRVTDLAVAGKVYKIYRCEALYDSLTVLMDAVDFARATPPSDVTIAWNVAPDALTPEILSVSTTGGVARAKSTASISTVNESYSASQR